LERANVFLIALDDSQQWYRYHHLFADLLRGRLTSGASGAAVAPSLRQRLVRAAGVGGRAVAHALAADNWSGPPAD